MSWMAIKIVHHKSAFDKLQCRFSQIYWPGMSDGCRLSSMNCIVWSYFLFSSCCPGHTYLWAVRQVPNAPAFKHLPRYPLWKNTNASVCEQCPNESIGGGTSVVFHSGSLQNHTIMYLDWHVFSVRNVDDLDFYIKKARIRHLAFVNMWVWDWHLLYVFDHDTCVSSYTGNTWHSNIAKHV